MRSSYAYRRMRTSAVFVAETKNRKIGTLNLALTNDIRACAIDWLYNALRLSYSGCYSLCTVDSRPEEVRQGQKVISTCLHNPNGDQTSGFFTRQKIGTLNLALTNDIRACAIDWLYNALRLSYSGCYSLCTVDSRPEEVRQGQKVISTCPHNPNRDQTSGFFTAVPLIIVINSLDSSDGMLTNNAQYPCVGKGKLGLLFVSLAPNEKSGMRD